MALAFSTLVVLILLLPGLLVVPGVYASDKVSRDAVPQGVLAQLAILIIAATLVHLLLFILINKLLPMRDWGAPQIDLKIVLGFATLGSATAATAGIASANLAQNIEEFGAWILGYFALASALGFILGFAVGRLIVKGTLRFIASNAWIYEVLSCAHKPAHDQVHAYVLCNIEHEGKRILYAGTIYHCQYGADGKLTYLVLSAARRALVDMSGEGIKIVGSDGASDWALIEKANAPITSQKDGKPPRPNVLFIDGSEIANVFFTPTPWKQMTTRELDELEKRVEAALKEDETDATASKNDPAPPHADADRTQLNLARPMRFRERMEARSRGRT